jgi:O-antigen ligase
MNNPYSRPRGKIGQWLASSVNELAVTFWTCTSFYLMYAVGGHNEYVLFIPLALGPVAFFWLTRNKPVIARVDPIVSFGVFLLLFSILGSYLFNSDEYEPIVMAGNVVSALLLFYALYLIVMKMELDFKKLLVLQSIYINMLLPVVLATSSWFWGRLEPTELHPNYVSMMGIVALIGALSVRSIFGFVALAALPVYTMVAMSSRGSMIASVLAMVIVFAFFLWNHRSKKLLTYIVRIALFGAIVSIGLTLLGIPIFEFIGNTVNKVFLLDDDLRGVNSGASGRSDLWAAAYNLWATHPIFGVGFKGHPQFMPENMPAHNAYLGLLADTGLTGLGGYSLIIAGGVYSLLKRGNKHLSMYAQRVAIILPYFIYGLVETRAFSFGNSYSVVFLLVVFDSAKRRLRLQTTPSTSFGAALPKKASFAEPVANH